MKFTLASSIARMMRRKAQERIARQQKSDYVNRKRLIMSVQCLCTQFLNDLKDNRDLKVGKSFNQIIASTQRPDAPHLACEAIKIAVRDRLKQL